MIRASALLFFALACSAQGQVKEREPKTFPEHKAVFAYEANGETLYLKWGSNRAGTPGGTVNWSLMASGTAGSDAYCGPSCPGTSLESVQVEVSPGGGFAPMTLASIIPYIEAALQRWAEVTGIDFEQVSDCGLPVNDPAAVPPGCGDIRIGIFGFSGGGGGAGFAPPPNGGSGAGEVLLNANAFFQVAPGSEGEAYDTGFAPNDLPGLLLHELGHAVGLAHPDPDGLCPVMQIDTACQGRINRELDADDIASAFFLYEILFSDGFETDSTPARN